MLLRSPVLLAITALLGWAQIPSPPAIASEPTARVEGLVRDVDGKPLENSKLRLTPSSGGRIEPRSVSSDASGKFAFEVVPPGIYNLSAEHLGYLPALYLIGPEHPRGPRDQFTLTLTAGSVLADVSFHLQPETVIAGRVTDEAGNAVPKPDLQVFRKGRWQGLELREVREQSLRTDVTDSGEFTIHGLAPGNYYIKVRVPDALRTPSGVSYVDTFYPSTELTSAMLPVDLPAEHDAARADIRLRKTRVFGLRGRVQDAAGQPAAADLVMIPLDTLDVSQYKTATSRNGAFSFQGVLPGRYLVQVYPDRVVGVPVKLTAQATFTVTSEIDDAVLRLTPAAEVSGTAMMERANGKLEPAVLTATQRIYLRPVDQPDLAVMRISAAAARNGSFSISDIPPGLYTVSATGEGYLKSAKLGNADILAEPFQLGSGSTSRIDLVLSDDFGQLRGVARNRDHKPIANAQVSAWLPGRVEDGSMDVLRTFTTNADGEYWLPYLPPGSYNVLAWERVETGLDGLREFRMKFTDSGSTVEIKPGSRVSFDPPLITRDRSDVEAAKVSNAFR
ncbi:MAG: carboxypeptidase-like regulatory domain-containing protein [Acidobacteriota bacterium]